MIGPILISLVPILILIAVNPTVAEKVGPNSFVGFRFPSTMLDREIWRTSHKKAWPWVIVPSLAGLLIIVYVWVDYFIANSNEINFGLLLSSVVPVIAGVVVGAIVAVRTARAV